MKTKAGVISSSKTAAIMYLNRDDFLVSFCNVSLLFIQIPCSISWINVTTSHKKEKGKIKFSSIKAAKDNTDYVCKKSVIGFIMLYNVKRNRCELWRFEMPWLFRFNAGLYF